MGDANEEFQKQGIDLSIGTKTEYVKHQFAPVFCETSKILILGTIPSPKSREHGFYYGHPRNRFWQVMADLYQEEQPQTITEKKSLCYRHGLAIWDVLASCEIKGASDSSIKNPVANDLGVILSQAPIKSIYTTGTKAATLYEKYCYPQTGMKAITLPSTSPANCRMSYEALKQAYAMLLS